MENKKKTLFITFTQLCGMNRKAKKALNSDNKIVIKRVIHTVENRTSYTIVYDDYSEKKCNQEEALIDIIDNVKNGYYYIENISVLKRCLDDIHESIEYEEQMRQYEALENEAYMNGIHDKEMDDKLREMGIEFDGSSVNGLGNIIYRITIDGKTDWVTKNSLLKL